MQHSHTHNYIHTQRSTYCHNGLKFVFVDTETGVALFRLIEVDLGVHRSVCCTYPHLLRKTNLLITQLIF